MGKPWMPLNNFKKVHEDNQKAVLQHPDGHEITLAKNILSPSMKNQLSSLPLYKGGKAYAKGGRVKKMADGGDPSDDDDSSPPQAPSPQDQDAPVFSLTGANRGPSPYSLMGPPQQGPQVPPQPQGPRNINIPQPPQPPPPQRPPGIMGQDPMQMMNQGLQEQRAGIQQKGNAEAAGAMMQAQAARQAATNMVNLQTLHMSQYKTLMQQYDALKTDYINGQINPNHYMDSLSTGQKIAAAIGIALSGYGTRGGANPGMQFLNAQINRDIQSQIMNLNKKQTLLSANMQMFGHMEDAIKMTQAMEMGIMSAKIQQAGAVSSSGAAQANAKMLSGQMDLQVGQMLNNLSLQQVLGGRVGMTNPQGSPQGVPGQPSGVNVNPNYLPQAQKATAVPMPGGGYGFAPNENAANQTRSTIAALGQMNQGLNDLEKNMQQEGRTYNPFGTRAQTAEDMRNNVILPLKQLYNMNRLNPEVYKQLESMVPSPGSWREGRAQEQINALRKFINNKMNAELGANVMNYQAPPTAEPNRNVPPGYADSNQ